MKVIRWIPENFEIIADSIGAPPKGILDVFNNSVKLDMPVYCVQDYIFPRFPNRDASDVWFVNAEYIETWFDFDHEKANTEFTEATLRRDDSQES